MKTWFCTICYHKHEAVESPEICTQCGADSRAIITEEAGTPDVKAKGFDGLPSNLDEVRERARIKLKGICAVYPLCDGKSDKICQREAYGKPIGFGGAGSGASFAANVAAIIRGKCSCRDHVRL